MAGRWAVWLSSAAVGCWIWKKLCTKHRRVRLTASGALVYDGQAADVRAYVERPHELQQKIISIIAGGTANLQVITDFDSTLTQPSTPSSWGVIERAGNLSEAYRTAAQALYDKYIAIEHDPVLSVEEKTPHMLDWCRLAGDLLMDEKPQKDVLYANARRMASSFHFRHDVPEMLQLLSDAKVPTLVLSAGVGDIIDIILHAKGLGHLHTGADRQLHIISNFLDFHPTHQHVVGFKGVPIHVYNKNEVVIKGSDFAEQVLQRRNVLLMGDSLGDVNMSEGVPHDTVIKVGFLNKNVDGLLPKYREVYDIVLVNDNSMTLVLQLLRDMMDA